MFGYQEAFAQKPQKNKKGTEEYHCDGPACNVASHNHNYYVPHKNKNRLATLKTRRVKHKDLSKKREKNIQMAHKSMENHRMKAENTRHRNLSNKTMAGQEVRHRDMNKARMRTFAVRHKSLENKQQKSQEIAHQNLEKYNQKFERRRHRNMNRYAMQSNKMRHRNLEGRKSPFGPLAEKDMRRKNKSSIREMRKSLYPTTRLRHRDLAQVCYPKYRTRHSDLSEKCLPQYSNNHKDLNNKCYPQYTVRHKDLQSKCYPTPKVKHADLSAECLPKYKQIKHENLSTVCYKPGYRVRHKDLNSKCYPTWVTRHKDFEKYTCTEIHVQHVPLAKYRVLCDPNIREHPSTMERIGVEVKDIFTRKRLFCKLENRYSGVSAGNLIETSVGQAVVKDYLVKKHTYYPLNLIVTIAKDPHHTDDGEPQTKDIKLSREETKEIMIRELIKRGKYVWLVRMYPEERKNLPDLKDLYLNPQNNPPPDGLNNN